MCIKNCYFLEATTRSSSLFCYRGLHYYMLRANQPINVIVKKMVG